MTRDEALSAAERHLTRAAELADQWDEVAGTEARTEIVWLEKFRVAERAAVHAAIGRGFAALSAEKAMDEFESEYRAGPGAGPSLPADLRSVSMCRHRVVAVRSHTGSWLHVDGMGACDSPPTG